MEAANRFAAQTRLKRKFVGFIERYRPEPPPRRPAQSEQVPWDDLAPRLEKIYDQRSAALHSGRPFAGPMLRPPGPNLDDACPTELPSPGWEGSASWSAQDLPMMLHTFAYLVGGALRRWWHSSCARDESAPQAYAQWG